jgi:hypothetical protein
MLETKIVLESGVKLGQHTRLMITSEHVDEKRLMDASKVVKRLLIARNQTFSVGDKQYISRTDDQARQMKPPAMNHSSGSGVLENSWRPPPGRVRLPSVGIKKDEMPQHHPPRRTSSHPQIIQHQADTENVWMRNLWVKGVPGIIGVQKPGKFKALSSSNPSAGAYPQAQNNVLEDRINGMMMTASSLTAVSIAPSHRPSLSQTQPTSARDSIHAFYGASEQEPSSNPAVQKHSNHAEGIQDGECTQTNCAGDFYNDSAPREDEEHDKNSSVDAAIIKSTSSQKWGIVPTKRVLQNSAIMRASVSNINPSTSTTSQASPITGMRQGSFRQAAIAAAKAVVVSKTDGQGTLVASRKKSLSKPPTVTPKTNILAKFGEFVAPSDEQWMKARRAAADYARGSGEEQALHEAMLSQFKGVCDECLACLSEMRLIMQEVRLEKIPCTTCDERVAIMCLQKTNA